MKLMTLGQFATYFKKMGIPLGTSGGIAASAITSGTIDAARLPSYVDDVLEYANVAAFPATGETGKIYVDLSTESQYRWSGSAYIPIGGGYVAIDTYANIVANYTGSKYLHKKAWATDGAGYELKYDGTNWIVQLYPNVTTALSISSGVVTVNCRAGYSRFSLALTENVTSWSFTNLPTTGRYRDIFIEVTQHASSAKTCVSPASAGKTAGWPWVVSPTLSSVEILGLRIFSDGTVHLFPGGVMA